jgi:hypothetical protein
VAAPRNWRGAKIMEIMMTQKTRRSPKPMTTAATNAKPSAPRGRQRQRTKKQIALALLERSKGASIAEMQKSMGWQAHSVRGFLAGAVRKMPGVTLISEKAENGSRRYRIEATAE